uniref:Diphosphoinositol polyphosphate phosphohydrolase n=1 Tax=Solanum tuberosum TaxID=4113 RepID=M1B5F1_SOLTU
MMFPKGGWEIDESLEEAASRETFEEAGVVGKKKANAVGRGGAQLQEDQDYAVLGGSAMHSRLQNVHVQEDMRGSGQANAPEQWLEMLHKASPKQIQQMRYIART